MLTSPTLRRGSDAGEDVERLLRADERGVKLRRCDGRRGGGDEGGQCGERLSVATRRERVERGVERDQSVVGFRDRGLGVGVQRRVLDLPAGDGGRVGGLGRREVGAQRGGALVRLASVARSGAVERPRNMPIANPITSARMAKTLATASTLPVISLPSFCQALIPEACPSPRAAAGVRVPFHP